MTWKGTPTPTPRPSSPQPVTIPTALSKISQGFFLEDVAYAFVFWEVFSINYLNLIKSFELFSRQSQFVLFERAFEMPRLLFMFIGR
jgi:hypothetical protein